MKRFVLMCAIAAPTLAAADEVGHWYVTPQIGGISVDNDRPLEDKDWLYGLAIGKHVAPNLSIEANFNGTQVGGNQVNPDLSVYGGSLDLLTVFNRAGAFSPYFSIGAGALENNPEAADNSTDFMAQAGVGAFWNVWKSSDGAKSFALRPDIKARWDDAGEPGYYRDYIATLGFQFAFGAPDAPPVREEPPAPAAPPPPPPPPPPPGPVDSDNDGVVDEVDKCPGTPAGVMVDSSGCPQKGSIVLEGVTFDVNKATLIGGSSVALESVAQGLKKHPRIRIELQGHTDSSGPDQYNMTLSQKRADAVRSFLLEQGVPSQQLTARGYGEGQPIADNTSAEGRAKNRRVVMFVLDNPGDVKVEGEGSTQ